MRIGLQFTAWLCLSLSALGQTPAPAPETENRISKEQAEELFQAVDEIVAFASQSTGLKATTPIQRQLSSRDELERYVIEKMNEDEDTKRLERSELIIKKFGLLPRDFQLRSFMVSLLREQVAGFYDSKKKTVYLLEWLSADAQRPVLAHELTHALQDQAIGIDDWIKQARAEARERVGAEAAEADFDEQLAARTALLEGQGMIVLLDYILKPSGRSVADAPKAIDFMRAQMGKAEADSMADHAPLLIRESMIFPYRDGMDFVYALLRNGGKEKAFAQALRRPPMNTREVMAPESYLAGESVAPMSLPDLEPVLGGKYESYDIGSIGQFDIALLAKQFADEKLAQELAPAWRGGVYAAVKRKGAALTTKDIALAYVSRWSSPRAARRFADFYATTIGKRLGPPRKNGEVWHTSEGELTIEADGEHVIIFESLDAMTRKAVEKALRASTMRNRAGVKVAAGNLSLRPFSPVYAVMLAGAK